MRTYTIGFTPELQHEQALLKSVLVSFGRRESHRWQYVDGAGADVVIGPAGRAGSVVMEQARALGKIVVHYGDGAEQAVGGGLLMLPKPVHARELIALLGRLEAYLTGMSPERS